MAEYIDKQALITEIQSAVSMVLQTAPYEKVWFDRFVDRQNEIVAIIERQPAAEVEQVRHGRWVATAYTTTSKRGRIISNVKYTCSECEWGNGRKRSNYCAVCGARIDGGAENG